MGGILSVRTSLVLALFAAELFLFDHRGLLVDPAHEERRAEGDRQNDDRRNVVGMEFLDAMNDLVGQLGPRLQEKDRL
jgi:hypothetical protein